MTMEAVIKEYRIEAIWHYTDRANLDSIREHGGLFSLKQLEEKGIAVPRPGGNNWSHDADRHKGLDVYIHLGFTQSHPMLFQAHKDGRITDPVWLKVDASVLTDPEVRFSSDVSNKNGVPILDQKEALKRLDFEALFRYMDWSDPETNTRRQAAEKSEILVPDTIPMEKILGYEDGKQTCICTAREATWARRRD